jgi:trans-aconitate 2-methyltransferase
MSWSAKLYTAFEDERTRPVRDLLNAVPAAGARTAVDLGCGPGNSTEVLAGRAPGAAITGIDSSPDMIEAARRRLPGVNFELATIQDWRAAAPVDLILSNAALHWVPDHTTLLPRLAGMLSAGGCLAVQLPDNLGDTAQLLMLKVASQGAWAARLADAHDARTPIGSIGDYYNLLKPVCTRVDIWRTDYVHPLAGPAAIVAWFRSTGLLPFLGPLDATERDEFLARYEDEVTKAYVVQQDGMVLLHMQRLFIVATK